VSLQKTEEGNILGRVTNVWTPLAGVRSSRGKRCVRSLLVSTERDDKNGEAGNRDPFLSNQCTCKAQAQAESFTISSSACASHGSATSQKHPRQVKSLQTPRTLPNRASLTKPKRTQPQPNHGSKWPHATKVPEGQGAV
jgi:hypothetical protein